VVEGRKMRVSGQLKDGTTFLHEGIIRIDDYQGIVTLHGTDGTPKANWKKIRY
jgi:hypothetical protein